MWLNFNFFKILIKFWIWKLLLGIVFKNKGYLILLFSEVDDVLYDISGIFSKVSWLVIIWVILFDSVLIIVIILWKLIFFLVFGFFKICFFVKSLDNKYDMFKGL